MIRAMAFPLVVATLSAVAAAAPWDPWKDQRVVSTNGEYYVVLNRTDGPRVYGEWGPVDYLIATRGPGSPPVSAANSEVVDLGVEHYDSQKGGQLYEIRPNPRVSVRDGDSLLGRGSLKRPPREIIVSDTGLGFAGLDLYGYNYPLYQPNNNRTHAVILVSPCGQLLHGKRLSDMFTDDELYRFMHTAGGIAWLDCPIAGWINEQDKRLVVVASKAEFQPNGHQVLFIDWRSGRVRRGPILSSRDDVKSLRSEHSQSVPRRAAEPSDAHGAAYGKTAST